MDIVFFVDINVIMNQSIQAVVGKNVYLISGSENIMDYRRRFRFTTRDIRVYIDGERETKPYFVMIHNDTGIPVLYPELESFISEADKGVSSGRTLSKKAKAITSLLNYILHETMLGSINELTENDIRNYLVFRKNKSNGKEVEADTWNREKNTVLSFLHDYYRRNKERLDFKYIGDEIFQVEYRWDEYRRRTFKQIKTDNLYVKPPKGDHRRKNRSLKLEYVKILLFEAKKYDPDIVLAIALQCYAGLREGEVVNLTCGGYVENRKGNYNSLSGIELDLSDTAPFFKSWEGKTDPGKRKQCKQIGKPAKVYHDFLYPVSQLYSDHIQRLESKGYGTAKNDPLFRNKQGKPMTVYTYCSRVKKLFYDHFLPDLIKCCIETNSYPENAAYIDAYKKEYPGAHMFRHWFTMYLFKKRIPETQIQAWRRDGHPESMKPYIQYNKALMDDYLSASFKFSRGLIDRIEKGENIIDRIY